jgi:hypothetical protein
MKTPLPNIDMMHYHLGDAAANYLVASHKEETATRELWAKWGFDHLTQAATVLGYKLVPVEQSTVEAAIAGPSQVVYDAETESWKAAGDTQ